MKLFSVSSTALMAAMILTLSAGSASARCLSKNSQMKHKRPVTAPSIRVAPRPVADGSAHAATDPATPATEASIAGFWYVQFLADKQLVDDGFDMWLSDGTEILNDSPAPAAGNVCMGVWTKTAPYTYTLKHPSFIFDDTNTTLIGVVIIREDVVLDPSGATFSGTSTVDAYDLSGNFLGEESADMTGQRVTAIDDPTATTPIPGLPASLLNRQ